MAGGVAIAARRRGRDGRSTGPGTESVGGGTAVAERPAPTSAPRGRTRRRACRRADPSHRRRAGSGTRAGAPSYRGRLGKARGLLSGYIGAVRARGKIDAATWDDLEEALIRADVGVGATDALLDDLRATGEGG